jgi:hypothetical protein
MNFIQAGYKLILKSISVVSGFHFINDPHVTFEVRGATKLCKKTIMLSPADAMALAQSILDDLQRIERAKKAGN